MPYKYWFLSSFWSKIAHEFQLFNTYDMCVCVFDHDHDVPHDQGAKYGLL